MRPHFSSTLCCGLILFAAAMGCSQSQESKIIPPPAASFPENAREMLRPASAGAPAPAKKAAATKPDEGKKDENKKDDGKKDKS